MVRLQSVSCNRNNYHLASTAEQQELCQDSHCFQLSPNPCPESHSVGEENETKELNPQGHPFCQAHCLPLKRHWLLVKIVNEHFQMWDKIVYHQDLDHQMQGAVGMKASGWSGSGWRALHGPRGGRFQLYNSMTFKYGSSLSQNWGYYFNSAFSFKRSLIVGLREQSIKAFSLPFNTVYLWEKDVFTYTPLPPRLDLHMQSLYI